MISLIFLDLKRIFRRNPLNRAFCLDTSVFYLGWLHTHSDIGRTTSVQFMSHQLVEYKVFIRDDMRHVPYDSRRAVVTHENFIFY
jgi:hypothetical protein